MQLKRNRMVIIERKLYIYSWSLNDAVFNNIGSLIQILKNKYSICFHFTNLFKCAEKFMFDYIWQYVESKELGFEFWFYATCFSCLPSGRSYQSLCFWGRESSMCWLQRVGAPHPYCTVQKPKRIYT